MLMTHGRDSASGRAFLLNNRLRPISVGTIGAPFSSRSCVESSSLCPEDCSELNELFRHIGSRDLVSDENSMVLS
jgi:hypothetical protein